MSAARNLPPGQRNAGNRAMRDAARLLRELRIESGMSNQEIAAELGVVPEYLSNVVAGRHGVSLHQLARIAHVMGYKLVLEAVER